MIAEEEEWNSFGHVLKLRFGGVSHGSGYEIELINFPKGIEITQEFVQNELDKRRPQKRKETDQIKILSGLANGKTTGEIIKMHIPNVDVRSEDYDTGVIRPGQADATRYARYYKPRGLKKILPGGGKISARETACRVAAGAFAKRYLETKGIRILAFTKRIGGIKTDIDLSKNLDKNFDEIYKAIYDSEIRCPDKVAAEKMKKRIEEVALSKNSIGGIVETWAIGLPVGVGVPVFDKLPADLFKALRSIPAVRAVEDGAENAADLLGSENNPIKDGTLGGMATGHPICLRVHFKPIASIGLPQTTEDFEGNIVKDYVIHGRHDVSAVPRAVPVVEAMMTLAIADHCLMWEEWLRK